MNTVSLYFKILLICVVYNTTFIKVVFADGDVILIPLTIRNGFESQISFDWPLKDKNAVFKNKYFKEQKQKARKAGIDLKKKMKNLGTSKYNKENDNFYMLFFNLAKAPTCKREYLVQRIKLTKSYFNISEVLYKKKYEYLVEVIKTKNKTTKRADQHHRSYSLNEAYRRVIKVEAEIGCGFVKGAAEGKKWPYKKNTLYKLIQDHSEKVGFYDDVRFNFSKKYSFGISFQKGQRKSVSWPSFMR